MIKSLKSYCYDTEEEFTEQVHLFLRESNAIEGIYSEEAFQDSLTAFYWLLAQKNITEANIRKIQKIITLHQPGMQPDWRGYLRHIPVYVGGKEALLWPFVKENLTYWIKDANKLTDPIADHIRFEKIHPFVDGNGRTGRMLMNWQYLKMGEPIQIFTAEDRGEYYKLFK